MGRSTIFNLISIIFLVLSVLWLVIVGIRLAGPPATDPAANSLVLPELVVLPTLTETSTPLPSSTPTDTLTPTISPTPSDTPTISPTVAPSLTITDTPTISPTPSDTPTPLATFTPLPSASPTGPTPIPTQAPSPFPFNLRDDSVIFTQNFANTAGCAWEGVGGQVFGLDGNPLTGLQIHVFGSDVDIYRQAGENTLYGPAGWEHKVADTINNTTYFVQLHSAQGTIVSDRIQVTFPSDCQQNLALIYFVQTRPL